jgi:inosine/xanthosine triphosphatase
MKKAHTSLFLTYHEKYLFSITLTHTDKAYRVLTQSVLSIQQRGYPMSDSLIVAVGTTSDLKMRAVNGAFSTLQNQDRFRIQGVDAKSGVSNQPFGFKEIKEGATNRALNAIEMLGAPIGIGIESGLVEINGEWYDPPCVAVVFPNRQISVAYGACFPIPSWIVEEIKKRSSELGMVVQELANGGEKDPHNYFSEKSIKRDLVIQEAVTCALVPYIYQHRYTNPF